MIVKPLYFSLILSFIKFIFQLAAYEIGGTPCVVFTLVFCILLILVALAVAIYFAVLGQRCDTDYCSWSSTCPGRCFQN